jgi:hypothetical protein
MVSAGLHSLLRVSIENRQLEILFKLPAPFGRREAPDARRPRRRQPHHQSNLYLILTPFDLCQLSA